MIRKVKVLALALGALLAVGALAANAAVANQAAFEVENSKGILHGEQIEGSHTFTLTDNGNLTTKCTTAKFTGVGEVEDNATTATLHPEYSGCTAFGLGATITTTGCDYVFHIGTEQVFEGVLEYPGTVDVACGSGSIVISAGTCEVKVDSQTELFAGTATNAGGAGNKMDIELHSKTKGIKYTVTKDGFLCPLTGTGGTEGDYTGTTTIRLYHDKVEPANQTGLTLKTKA